MKTEPIESNDPQITAYAIGELRPDEAADFECQLAQSPTAEAELDEIRETVSWLREGFADELQNPAPASRPCTALATVNDAQDPGENDGVLVELKKNPPVRTMLLSLAAVLTGLMVVGSLITQQRQTGQGGAGNEIAATNLPPTPPAAPGAGEMVNASAGGPEINASGENGLNSNVPELRLASEIPDYSAASYIPVSATVTPPVNAGSYLDYENLTPTPVMEIQADKFSGLPGLGALMSGQPGFGTYKFHNPDESVANLPDDEYGHGNLSFVIRKRTINGRKVETIRLTDRRVNPDGTEKVTVKEYTREGSEITPTGAIVPGDPDSKNLVNLINLKAPSKSLTIGEVQPLKDEPSVMEQYHRINEELSAISESMANDPGVAELEALQSRLDQAVKRQTELGREIEAVIGQ
ncbi:MAG: hypothetical protein HKN23_09345 [Verrucomicrobiales bacterium]|nr:hypothetical protein [Verrucomicrobiales bacterium]